MTQVHRTIDPDGVRAAVGDCSHVPDGFAERARVDWRNLERCLVARPVVA